MQAKIYVYNTLEKIPELPEDSIYQNKQVITTTPPPEGTKFLLYDADITFATKEIQDAKLKDFLIYLRDLCSGEYISKEFVEHYAEENGVKL